MSCHDMYVRVYETPYAGACAPTLREMTDWLVAARMRARVIAPVFSLIANQRFALINVAE